MVLPRIFFYILTVSGQRRPILSLTLYPQSWDFLLFMMVPTSLKNLMSTVDLLDENKKCKWMGHDKIRNTEKSVRNLTHELEIDSITSTNNKYKIFAWIFRFLDHFSKFARFHTFSSFIEQYDPSFHLFEHIYDTEGLFYFDIFRIRMRNRLYILYSGEFLYTLFIFFHCLAKMFKAIRDSKNSNHALSIKKFFDKTTIFYTICPVPP